MRDRNGPVGRSANTRGAASTVEMRRDDALTGQDEFDHVRPTQFEPQPGPMQAPVEGVDQRRRHGPPWSEREPEFGERTDHVRGGVCLEPGT